MTYYKCSVTGKVHQFEECGNGGTHTPVVVIDPEDSESLERLYDLLSANSSEEGALVNREANLPRTQLRAALREFAKPKPPKPDEPKGFGAVVKDSKGDLWGCTDESERPGGTIGKGRAWRRKNSTRYDWWDDIDVVEVLNEGVTE